MKLDSAYMWMGGEFPEFVKSKTTEAAPDRPSSRIGPFELTSEEFATLAEQYDVAIMHAAQLQPTRKQRAAGARPVPDLVYLALDVRGGKFRQR